MSALPRDSLEDSLADTRQAVADMLDQRNPHFSLPQPFYNDSRLFALDMQHVFEKQWLFACMSCEIPAKGNFFKVEIGSNSIIVVRGAENRIQAFHNVCRHRGSRLCLKDKGKVAKLVCPYHQWTYELDGRLLFAGSDMGTEFDMSAYGLKPVAVKSAGGFVFINLSDDPEPIDDFLVSLEHYLSPYEMDNVKVAVESNIVERANWKLVIENNRECYHCNGAHPELLNSLIEFDDTDDPRSTGEYRDLVARKQADWTACEVPWQLARFGKRHRLTRTPLIDGIVSMTMDGKPGCNKLMGHMPNADMGSLRILHLPNSWNHFMGDHAVVFRVLPLGPQETLVTTKWLVHKDAVEGVDYDPERLRQVWDATNDQDRRLAEENQLGINSLAYQPGPYSTTYEFGVIDFVDWYSETLRANLGVDQPATLQVAAR
ncbi:aromatic ring-hydroxylating oxygenase subunit alpha [Salinicola halophyticus]|uniref:aromatic ring-hydroxylating oxygenase subunit alpha n=1 Tax=Salinicola halophyticus TaxID=1808881 RepID=UPI003F471CEC